MIPERRRAALPAGHWWTAREQNGRLIVTLNAAIPCDSDLENTLVQIAAREWRRTNRGLPLLPIPAVGGSVDWLIRRTRRRPAVAAATGIVAAVGVGLAVLASSEPHSSADRHPPAAIAPPAAPTAHPPSHAPKPTPRDTSDRPGHPNPSPTGSKAPAGPPVGGEGAPSSSPPHTPPPTVEPAGPPVVADPPPPGRTCRLAEIHVGKLVRICL